MRRVERAKPRDFQAKSRDLETRNLLLEVFHIPVYECKTSWMLDVNVGFNGSRSDYSDFPILATSFLEPSTGPLDEKFHFAIDGRNLILIFKKIITSCN